MSDQLLLLDVPKDSPRRERVIKTFKDANGIWTLKTGRRSEPEGWEPWLAMLLPEKHPHVWDDVGSYCKSKDPFEVMAGACRLMDDYGYVITDFTERAAIRRLCAENKIPCDL